MAWSLAPSLAACLREANATAPHRSRVSDGTIGDQAHSARTSDHNPGARDRVHAIDLTHDPLAGWDAHARVDELRRNQDRRVKYLISAGRIAGPGTTRGGWDWHTYTGTNRHDRHAHISIHSTVAAETDTRPWWPAVAAPPTSRTVHVHVHLEDSVKTHDRIEQLDQTGCAQWFSGVAWERFVSVEACHPTRPHADGRYAPGLAAQPAEDDGKILVVVTGGPAGGQARVLLTVSDA